MNKTNYDLLFRAETEKLKRANNKPQLLLHACCAPCSTACLTRLTDCFDITVYFYNPNITDRAEYGKRRAELETFLARAYGGSVKLLCEPLNASEFYAAVKGFESVKEGGERCFRCYKLRLEKTAETASEKGFDYFTTTLSVSPYKNAAKLNEIGAASAEKYGVKYLFSDFKKGGGYLKSVELSTEYGLYRQDYCGCEFSKTEAENRQNQKRLKT